MKVLMINLLDPGHALKIQSLQKLFEQRVHINTPQLTTLINLTLKPEHQLRQHLQTVTDLPFAEPMFRMSEDHQQEVIGII